MGTLDISTSPTLRLLVHLVGRRTARGADGRAPTDEELAWLLRAATTVPDHGSLRPWRFVVIADDARHRLAEALAADVAEQRDDAPPPLLERARRKAFAAPALIVLIASPRAGSNVPDWGQVASAACCGYAIVLAAHALGLGAVWKSPPYRDGKNIRALCHLSEIEQLLGWVNVGANDEPRDPELRPPLALSSVASVLATDGPQPYHRAGVDE